MGQQDILEARSSELLDTIKKIIDTADTESRGITDQEQVEINGHHAEIRAIDEKLTTLTAVKAHLDERGRTLDTVKPITVPHIPVAYTEERSEPYRKGGTDSYFLDLYRAENKGDTDARQRLDVSRRYRDDMEKRAGATTVAGAGGELAPPAWLENQLVELLRPGRIFADRLNKSVLPANVSSINLPKISTGTALATQTTQNTAINIQDIATTSVSTGITTVAGGTTVSLQLLQQSPISIDDVITKDLAKALARQIDVAALTAVAAVSGINAVSYTDASPTSLKITQQVQQAIDAVSNAVFEVPTAIVMRPERWGKILTAGDSAGRPLALPSTGYGPNNALGLANGQNAQGYAGNLRGVDVYLDPNIPVNLGAGTNQDEIFVLRGDEINLYESAPQFGVFEQTYANTLSLFIRAHEFFGIIANRYPGAISLITGTGLINTLAYGA